MPARNQRKIQPNILIYLNMIMFFFLIQIWHIGRDHICYLGSRVSHIFHTVTGYLNKTWTSINIQQIWTGSSHGFFCHMYLAHQRRSYGRQTPLFACISCILCGLNWFSFRTEKKLKEAKLMKKCHKYIFSSSKRNCIFYQMTTSVMFLSLALSYMLSLSHYSLVLALSLFVSHSLAFSVTR